VGHQRVAALESHAHTRHIGGGGLMTKSVTALLASTRAIPRACRRPRSTAHQAATGTLTPTLTHGHVAGRRHSCACRARLVRRRRAGRRARYHCGQRDC
jgi:hypothetical protein